MPGRYVMVVPSKAKNSALPPAPDNRNLELSAFHDISMLLGKWIAAPKYVDASVTRQIFVPKVGSVMNVPAAPSVGGVGIAWMARSLVTVDPKVTVNADPLLASPPT